MKPFLTTRKNTLIGLLCLASVACNKGEEVSEYNIKEKIDQYLPQLMASDSLELAQFDVCQLFPASGWDRVHIVHPYTTLDSLRKLDLANFSAVKNEFRHFANSDSDVGFLFVKSGDIVSYTITTRELVFSDVTSFTRQECQNLYIKRYGPANTTHLYVALDAEKLF